MGERILVVEDESIVQLDLRYRLERLGYEVVGVASRGEEAVSKADELQPDLVLMDVHLDGRMDGVEAAGRIRAARQIPIVYITAYGGRFVDGGTGTLYPSVSKPFRTEELRAAIAKEIARASKRGPDEAAIVPSNGFTRRAEP